VATQIRPKMKDTAQMMRCFPGLQNRPGKPGLMKAVGFGEAGQTTGPRRKRHRRGYLTGSCCGGRISNFKWRQDRRKGGGKMAAVEKANLWYDQSEGIGG